MKARVIIADHNSISREKIKRSLEPAGIDIVEALSGREILNKAKLLNPEVIVINSVKETDDAREAVRVLKSDETTRSIPLIVIARDDDDYEWHEAFEVISASHEVSKIKEDVTRLIAQRHSMVSELVMAQEGFTDEDFERFQEFLMSKIGLFFDYKRKLDLMRALKRRMLAVGIVGNFAAYFSFLAKSPHESRELKNLILHITVGETTFFRSPDQIKGFREYILPKLVKAKLKQAKTSNHKPRLNIWTAGCSTGEEPYTIVITLMEDLENFHDWDINVYASDINTRFLKTANKAVYPARKVRFVPKHLLRKYFTEENGQYRVIDKVRNMVKFDFHNLSSKDFSKFKGKDVIFCRNVLIYFKRDRIKYVIEQLRDSLVPNGYLILGYSETLFQISTDFKSIHYGDAFFYQKDINMREIIKEKEEQIEPVRLAATGNFVDISAPFEKPLPFARPPKLEPIRPIDTELPPKKPALPLKQETLPELIAISDEVIEAKATEMELWEQGLKEYFEEKFEEAEVTFNRIKKLEPNSARAELGQAFILANKGKDDETEEKCRNALEINEFLPEAYYLLGLVSEKKGNNEEAIRQYQRVLLLDPDFAMAHFNLAIMYLKFKRNKEAQREFINTLDILERWDEHHSFKFSGGLHRDALIQLCRDMQG